MKTIATICLAGFCLAGFCQQQPDVTIRQVKGTVYYTTRSALWSEGTFEFLQRTNSLVIANKIKYEDIKETRWTPGNASYAQSTGHAAVGSGTYGSGYRSVTVGKKRILDGRVAITNWLRADLMPGKEYKVNTMVSGSTTNMPGQAALPLHDCGTVYLGPTK